MYSWYQNLVSAPGAAWEASRFFDESFTNEESCEIDGKMAATSVQKARCQHTLSGYVPRGDHAKADCTPPGVPETNGRVRGIPVRRYSREDPRFPELLVLVFGHDGDRLKDRRGLPSVEVRPINGGGVSKPV